LHMKNILNDTRSVVEKRFNASMGHHFSQNHAGPQTQKLSFLRLLVIDLLLKARSVLFLG
ncbi:hypothetical protein AN697_25625, partial [Enterobacter cloacae subsp. cloacae]